MERKVRPGRLAGATAYLVTVGIGLVTNLVSGPIDVEGGWRWAPSAALFVLIVLGVVLVLRELGVGEGRRVRSEAARERRGYLEALRGWARPVELQVLLPSEQSEHPEMLLGEVFVPQLVRENPPQRELLDVPREVLVRLVAAGRLAGLPDGVDRAELERAHRAYRDRPARPVLEAVAAAPGGVVVLGDPGAGKSTLARFLMLVSAEAELGGRQVAVLPGDLAGRLPLVVELRQFADEQWEDKGFLDFLQDKASEGLGLSREWLEDYLDGGGRALVVFDGLDEVFEPARRGKVSRQIAEFARRHPAVRVIATSRVIGYDRAVFDKAGFTTLMLQDLTRKQIDRFATAWFDHSHADQPAEAARLRRRIIAAVEGSSAVAELAGNPMLLTILAIIARRRELPKDRRSVYEHAVLLLIDQWDVAKQLTGAHPDLQNLKDHDKRRMLRAVARRMQEGTTEGLAGNRVPGDDLVELFRGYFTDRRYLPPDRALQAAETMLAQLRERNFILSSYGAGLYGFVHRAFLEYLAADDINQQFTDRTLDQDQLFGIYSERWADPAWDEVLLLLAGMLPERFAATALTHLLDADPAWRARQRPPQHLLLALRIAGEIDHSPELAPYARTITLQLIALLDHTAENALPHTWTDAVDRAIAPHTGPSAGLQWLDHALYQRWHSSLSPESLTSTTARILIATHSRSLPELQHIVQTSQDPDVRHAAVDAVGTGWAGNDQALDLLRDLATHDQNHNVRRAASDLLGYLS